MRVSLVNGFLLVWMLVAFACTDNRQSGIEIGNPTITVSAEFSIVEGEPSYSLLLANQALSLKKDQIAINAMDFSWLDLRLPLTKVRYYGSYYYYVPTDPTEGTQLWPTIGDTLLQMEVLKGDTLQADFENMDIPSRSYLKEVGIHLNLSKHKLSGQWCPVSNECRNVEFSFSDSVKADIRFHYSQLQKQGDSLHVRLPVNIHPKMFLSTIDIASDTIGVHKDSTIRIQLSSIHQEAFIRSFAALRYQLTIDTENYAGILPAALADFDRPNIDRLIDGTFEKSNESWIFLKQLGGVADTSYNKDSTVLIDIKEGGKKDYAIQWMQEDVELIKGRWYKLIFNAWSNKENALILSRVGRYHAPYDNLDDANEDFISAIGLKPTEFSYEFRAKETTPFGRLEFNLGGYAARKIYFKSIHLYQLNQ